MKLAIDSYSYHRLVRPPSVGLDTWAGASWSMDDVVADAVRRGLDGISVEHFMLDVAAPGAVEAFRARTDDAGLEVAWAWGHPFGLRSGEDAQALEDLVHQIQVAGRLGCGVMRIVCGGRSTRPPTWAEHRARLIPPLERAVRAAVDEGVVLAIENHVDLRSDELVELVEHFDTPYLRVCLDTANSVRLLEDPLEANRRLAPLAAMVHVKDVVASAGDPHDVSFWPSVPLGDGIIDIPDAMGALWRAGYRGLLAIEVDQLAPGTSDELTVLDQSVEYLRATVETIGERENCGSGRTPTGNDVLDRYVRGGLGGSMESTGRVAVVVVDLQKGFTDPAAGPGFSMPDVVGSAARLVEAAHVHGVPVYFTAIEFDVDETPVWLTKMPVLDILRVGTRWTEIDPEAGVLDTDVVIVKKAASAFSGTDLEEKLQAAGIATVIICGATTSGCVRATAVDAVSAGFRPFVVESAVGDRERAPHAAALVDIQAKYGEVVTEPDAIQIIGGSARSQQGFQGSRSPQHSTSGRGEGQTWISE